MEAHDPSDATQEFGGVGLVLRGQQVPEDIRGLPKVLTTILYPPDGVDVEMSASRFHIRCPLRPKPSGYSAEAAPATLQALLRFGGVARVSQTAAFRIDPDPLHEPEILRSYSSRWVWLRIDDDAVRIGIRPASAAGPPPATPSGLPPPLPLLPPKVYATFSTPLACPHCRTVSLKFRRVGAALVCHRCGRSHRPEPRVLERGSLREEAR